MLIIYIRIEEDKSWGALLLLKITFFGGFENDNILSSKSYRVTKSEITSQLKLGSLPNLKLKLIR